MESLSLSIGARAIKALPLQIPSSKSNHNLGTDSDAEVDHNLGTDSDAEVEEIGAIIYDHLMQRRQSPIK